MQLTPEAAHVLLLQSRHVERGMLPARQAVLDVLHGLHAEQDMGSIAEVGAGPTKPRAGLCHPAMLMLYPWLPGSGAISHALALYTGLRAAACVVRTTRRARR